MFGFDAITYYNGWAMAVAGALIVVSGLVVLSFVISQLHKIVALIDKPPQKAAPAPKAAETAPTLFIPDRCPANLNEAAVQYQPLVEQLPAEFELSQLYDKAVQAKLPHPHLTIRCLRETGRLVPMGDGIFKWSNP